MGQTLELALFLNFSVVDRTSNHLRSTLLQIEAEHLSTRNVRDVRQAQQAEAELQAGLGGAPPEAELEAQLAQLSEGTSPVADSTRASPAAQVRAVLCDMAEEPMEQLAKVAGTDKTGPSQSKQGALPRPRLCAGTVASGVPQRVISGSRAAVCIGNGGERRGLSPM